MTETSSTPTHEQISRRAHEIFIERGCPAGRDLDHWLEAEAQLKAAAQGDAETQVRQTQTSVRSPSNGRSQPRARK